MLHGRQGIGDLRASVPRARQGLRDQPAQIYFDSEGPEKTSGQSCWKQGSELVACLQRGPRAVLAFIAPEDVGATGTTKTQQEPQPAVEGLV